MQKLLHRTWIIFALKGVLFVVHKKYNIYFLVNVLFALNSNTPSFFLCINSKSQGFKGQLSTPKNFPFASNPLCILIVMTVSEYLDATCNGEFTHEQRAFVERLLNEYLTDDYLPDRANYRIAGLRCLRVLYAIDHAMSGSSEPIRVWHEISLALNLPSSRDLQLTEAAIGRRFGITKMGVSKSIKKLLRLAELKPKPRGYNGRG